jgi:AcrR family transcriptional regulator
LKCKSSIGKAAEISIPTLYALFKSKLGILRALMDEALPVEQFVTLVEEAMNEKAASKHLCITAKIARQIYDAEKAQMDIFQGASVLALEFKILEQ